MKKVTTNQICGLIMLVTISNKLLILPSIMYEDVGSDAIFVVILKLLLAFLAFWIFAYIAKNYPNKTLDDLLVPYIGKFCYGVLLFLFGVFYLIKTFLTLSEGELFLGETIYISLPAELYAIPTFIVAGYFVYKGARIIGRTNETVFRVIFWGVIISILLTIPNLNLETLFPLFTSSPEGFAKSFSHISMWFGNYFVIYLFLGKTEISKNFISKVLKSYILSALVVLAFFIVYYSVFGESSVIHSYAINDVVTLTPQLSSLIKINWFTVIFYSMALIGQVVLQLYLVFVCFQKIFKVKSSKMSVSIFVGVLTVVFLILPFSNVQIINFCSEQIGLYCFLLNLSFPALILIILMILNYKRAKEQKLKIESCDYKDNKRQFNKNLNEKICSENVSSIKLLDSNQNKNCESLVYDDNGESVSKSGADKGGIKSLENKERKEEEKKNGGTMEEE